MTSRPCDVTWGPAGRYVQNGVAPAPGLLRAPARAVSGDQGLSGMASGGSETREHKASYFVKDSKYFPLSGDDTKTLAQQIKYTVR